LSYNERCEWEQMEAAILEAERVLDACHRAAHDPAVAANAAVVAQRYAELQGAQEQLDRLYARWAELEAKQTDS